MHADNLSLPCLLHRHGLYRSNQLIYNDTDLSFKETVPQTALFDASISQGAATWMVEEGREGGCSCLEYCPGIMEITCDVPASRDLTPGPSQIMSNDSMFCPMTTWEVIVTLTVLGLSRDAIGCLSPSTLLGRVSQDVIVTVEVLRYHSYYDSPPGTVLGCVIPRSHLTPWQSIPRSS